MKNKIGRRTPLEYLRSTPVLVALSVAVCILAVVITPLVKADQYQDQINALESQNSNTQSLIDSLQGQASSYQDAINILDSQVSGLQQSISDNQAKQTQLQQQITTTQQQISQDKQELADDIKTMYISGSATPIEELATSNNLSTYVDQQVAYEEVQDDLNSLITKISTLQNSLQQQNEQLTIVINTEKQQNDQLSSDLSQQQQLLAYNQSQQDTYNQQIQANQKQISVLQQEQIAANRALVSTGVVDASGSCGGSYPATASGPIGPWGCDYPLDSSLDNWGMDNRECVSYTAWMVYSTYGYMPYWGGSGNANEWPSDAAAAGIPTGSTPEVNSVAIYMGGSGDPYGHAMWVKSVNSDGTITVDQYNLYYDGNFYETTIPSSGLVYIYFGG